MSRSLDFISLLLRLLEINRGVSKLILSGLINRINPHLIQVNKEDDIITEASDSVKDRHLNNKGEHIINKSIQGLVDHGIHRNMSHALQLVVDKQLRSHGDEAEQVHKVCEGGDDPVIPGLMSIIDQGIDSITSDQGIENAHQMAHGGIVVLLGLAGTVSGAVVNAQNGLVALPVEADLHCLGDLP